MSAQALNIMLVDLFRSDEKLNQYQKTPTQLPPAMTLQLKSENGSKRKTWAGCTRTVRTRTSWFNTHSRLSTTSGSTFNRYKPRRGRVEQNISKDKRIR